jgi:hypothetical protein
VRRTSARIYKHGIFTHAWLQALRGQGPQMVYEEIAHGNVPTLSGPQFAVN